MTEKRAIFAWAFCLLGATWLGGCRAPVVNLHNVNIEEMSRRKIGLELEFKVHNPNWCDLPLSNLEYAFQTEGKAFAKGKLPPPVPIVPGGETVTVLAPLNLQREVFMPIIRKCWSGKEAEYRVHIRATFRALGVDFPVTLTVKNTLPAVQLPKWSLKQTRLKKGSTPLLVLVFELENPNSQALSIASLAGQLKSGENVVMEIFQPAVTNISGGQKVRVEVPIQLRTMELIIAITKAIGTGELLQFEGGFKLKKPLEIK